MGATPADRPRRAFSSDDSGAPGPTDDTPASAAGRARRGSPAGRDDEPTGSGSGTPLQGDANPFARPGSQAAAEPPAVATPIPAPIFPRSSGIFADSPGPAPRRSALSSDSPYDPDPQADDVPWWTAHRATLAMWAIGGVVTAILVGLLTFFVVRGASEVSPAPSPSPSPSASGSVGPAPATADDLLTAQDLAELAPAASWSVTSTTLTADEHANRPLCLSTETLTVNPVVSLQRVLATSGDDGLAALHRIEVFADAETASAVMTQRIAALGACSEVPVLLVGAETVTGLAEEAFAVTIAVDTDAGVRHHTLLLTRSGAALQLLDGTRAEAIPAADLAQVVTRAQTALSAVQGQPAPADVAAAAALLPSTEPTGWLSPSDIPRVRAGFGRWTYKGPTDVTSPGTGCENMTLASEPGPASRSEVTYLLSQDDQMPSLFGMDQITFDFDTTEAADAFVTKLGNAIASCKDRVNTATVAEQAAVAGTGVDGVPVSSRIFTVTQAQGGSANALFQVIVSKADARIVYTLVTVEDDYRFSDAQLAGLGVRIPVRTSQTS